MASSKADLGSDVDVLSLRKTWKCNKAESSAGGEYLPKEVVNQVVKP